MKSNFLELMKVDLRESLDVRKFKENKGKSLSFIALIALFVCLGLFLSTVYSLLFGTMFSSLGTNMVYNLMFMVGLASVFALSTAMFKIKAIFVGKDYEMLRSMPIKKTAIIASKIVNLYLIELLYSAVLLIPNVIVCTVLSQDFSFVLLGLVYVLFIPMLPMLVAGLFSLFVTLIADRFKFGNIINFILYMGLFVCIFLFSFMMNSGSTDAEAVESMMSSINGLSWVNPTSRLILLTHTQSYFYVIVFAAVNLGLFALVVMFIALLFDKVHESINSYRSNTVYVRKKLESKGQFGTLLSLEAKRYFTSKYYFLNTISSGIAAIVMCGFLGFGIDRNLTEGTEIYNLVQRFGHLAFLAIILMIGISTPASCSINIEGKTFWMLKSLPLDHRKTAQAKLFLSSAILGVCSLFASTLVVCIIPLPVFAIVMIYILPLLFVVLASEIGLIINLHFYKLNWKNEVEAVKQSASVVITMLADWGVAILLAGVSVGLAFVNIYVSGLVTLAILAIGSIVLYIVTMAIVQRRIDSIE